MSKLQRTEFALTRVKAHLTEMKGQRPDIESFLVQYLIVLFYAEMEEMVKRVYRNRLHVNGDHRLEYFVSKTNDRMMRRLSKSEIKELAKCFGEDCKEIFDRNLEEHEEKAYSSVISNRHNTVHGNGATLTIIEVEKGIAAADSVLISLENAIR